LNCQIDIIVICGPTAAGKTRLGAGIAHEFGLEIISADSRQVYKGLDIGTGKDLEEYRFDGETVTCHLLNVEDPEKIYSLFRYQEDCYTVLRDLQNSGRSVLMIGGTGLYIEAVIRKFPIAQVPEDVELRRLFMREKKEELAERLKQENHDLYLSTDITSKKRIVRSLEIHEYSKRDEVRYSQAEDLLIRPHVFCINPPKEELHAKIRARLRKRLDEGMLQEVQRLMKQGLATSRLLQLGMEYREITLYLTGKKSRNKMEEDLEREIRRMAKQQITYFRGFERRGLKVIWLDSCTPEPVREKIRELLP
jgi:tRNA dimethylallyltransferase